MKHAVFALLAALAAPAAHAVEYTTVLPQQSSIGFQFRQMGVPVKGGFKRFNARIRFDPARPEAAQAALEIDLASIDTGSALCSAPHKADYVDRSIMWTIGGGMFRAPCVAWLFGD